MNTGRAARIAEAEREGREWVLLEDEAPRADAPFRRMELHVPTGVAVVYGARRSGDGSLEFYTESHFVNRRTGEELPCGSRRWNEGSFSSLPELLRAVEAAREDVPRRFAGMVEIYRRRRTGSSQQV